MQYLFQLDVQGEDIMKNVDLFLVQNEADELSRTLAGRWVREAWYNLKACDDIIEASTIKWGLSRLSAVDRSILRLAVFQLLFCDDIPPKVVINEAIELGKKYGAEHSSSFINGVLDAALKKITKGSDEEQI